MLSSASSPSLPLASMTPGSNRQGEPLPRSIAPGSSNSSFPQPEPSWQADGSVTPMPPVFVPGQSASGQQIGSFTPVISSTPSTQPTSSIPQMPPSTPLTPSSPPKRTTRRRGLWIALSVLLLLALIGSSLGAYFTFFANRPPSVATTATLAGYAYFVSSGLLSTSPDSNQGITDQMQIVMKNISPPPSGKNYYAWLLNDKTQEWKPILLGQLNVNNGVAVLSYNGDAGHTNLLATNSRFFITEEDATTQPVNPGNTIAYYAEFSQIPNSTDPKHFSLYDHIRHLLANDPNVQAAGLTGGLDIWLYKNTQKVLEWAGSARDAQRTGGAAFARRQLTRILDYLDGTYFIQRDLDGQPLLVDKTIAKIGLLTFDPANQEPPGYVYHMGKHLHEITSLPQSTSDQKALAAQINQELNTVDSWFHIMRFDALHLYQMSDAQLLGNDGRTMIDSLATLANDAFVGELNPQGQLIDGVVQIHYNIQRLATFDIQACTTSQPCPALV